MSLELQKESSNKIVEFYSQWGSLLFSLANEVFSKCEDNTCFVFRSSNKCELSSSINARFDFSDDKQVADYEDYIGAAEGGFRHLIPVCNLILSDNLKALIRQYPATEYIAVDLLNLVNNFALVDIDMNVVFFADEDYIKQL